MLENKKNRGLGRGLSALIGGSDIDLKDMGNSEQFSGQRIPVELLRPNPDQPRIDFDEQDLKDLAASIAERGVIQPLIVRPDPSGKGGRYQIVAGERRWRAAQRAQLHEVPAIIREFSDSDVLEIAIIENIQRSNLNAIEEAQGYRNLIDKFGHTQERLAISMGKSRSHITNLLRLLSLPAGVKSAVCNGSLSMGHARALLSSTDPVRISSEVIARGLSVRETERLVKGEFEKKQIRVPKASKDADTKVLEGEVSASLGLTVSINQKSESKGGTVSIRYRSLEELEGLISLLCKEMM